MATGAGHERRWTNISVGGVHSSTISTTPAAQLLSRNRTATLSRDRAAHHGVWDHPSLQPRGYSLKVSKFRASAEYDEKETGGGRAQGRSTGQTSRQEQRGSQMPRATASRSGPSGSAKLPYPEPLSRSYLTHDLF